MVDLAKITVIFGVDSCGSNEESIDSDARANLSSRWRCSSAGDTYWKNGSPREITKPRFFHYAIIVINIKRFPLNAAERTDTSAPDANDF